MFFFIDLIALTQSQLDIICKFRDWEWIGPLSCMPQRGLGRICTALDRTCGGRRVGLGPAPLDGTSRALLRFITVLRVKGWLCQGRTLSQWNGYQIGWGEMHQCSTQCARLHALLATLTFQSTDIKHWQNRGPRTGV